MKTQTKVKENLTVMDLQANAIGNTDMRKNKDQAQKALVSARKSDANKIKLGYKWMGKDKTSRLVSPAMIEQAKNDGWK